MATISQRSDGRLPHDLDAERIVLGALLQNAPLDSIGEIAAEDFYRPAHQIVYETVTRLAAAGSPHDSVAVLHELQSADQVSKMGGAPYLHECIAAVPSIAQAPYYAAIVRAYSERRRVAVAAERVRQAALDPSHDIEVVRDLAVGLGSEIGVLASSASAGDRRLVLTPVADIVPRPVTWGWQDRLPSGHLSLIPGREGIGKSLLLTWFTARLTRGELKGVFFGRPRPVFYCASEDSWERTIAPRLIASGADLDLVYRVEVEAIATGDRIELSLPRDLPLVADEVKRLEVAMIALDPLMSVIDRMVDTYNDRDMRTVLEPLCRLADETDCMIIGLAHFNKTSTDDPLTLVTGSRAFTAVVRAVLAVARDPEADSGACVVSQVKNNLGRTDLPNLTYVTMPAIIETREGDAETAKLVWTGESDRSVRDILAEAGNGAERSERAECVEWLRTDALAAGPQPTKQVEAEGRERGYSQRTQWRARKQLGVRAEQLPTGPKGRNEWWLSLPAQESGCHEAT